MNVKLLEKVRDAILMEKDYRAFNMETWVKVKKDEKVGGFCGTTHCIGGMALIQAGKLVPAKKYIYTNRGLKFDFVGEHWGAVDRNGVILEDRKGNSVHAKGWTYFDLEEAAAKALKLDEFQADRLFYVSDWPEAFKDVYLEAQKNAPQACPAIAAARIQHFIQTEGRE